MHGRETAGNDLARRVVLVVLGMTFFALAALMWPSQAAAQTSLCAAPGCRPLCVAGVPASPGGETVPLRTLTALKTGGDGTFEVTAENPYAGASYNSPENKVRECATKRPDEDVWDVKHWCTFHCEHRHYFVTPGGLPQPATAWVTASESSGSHFLGWEPESLCAPPASLAHERDECVQKMNKDQTVTAEFGPDPDTTPPSAPVLAHTATHGDRVTFAITTVSTDDEWLGGYEVFVNDELRTRVRPDAQTFTIANLFCETDFTFRIDAFDSQNSTSSNEVDATTSTCPKVAPNAVFHVKPARRSRDKSPFFHWGARRGGVDLRQGSFQSRCKVDKRRWTKCSAVAGKTVRKLQPGWHTFRVKVGDSQGWDRTPAIWRWQLRR